MFKDMGRLGLREIKENEEKVEQVFKFIDEDEIEMAKKQIVELLNTPNYFIRELVGRKLVEYHDSDKMDRIIISFLGHKTYGVRAATLFYYFVKYFDDPHKIMTMLNMSWCDTPWETEHVLHEMWLRYPEMMKKEMAIWAVSEFEKQRALAYHGLDELSNDEPHYVASMLEKNLDDEGGDVQKKLSNVLTQFIRIKPAEGYPYVREWLTNGSETRSKTLYLAIKKLVSIAVQGASSGKLSKNDDFYVLTMHTISDWKNDPNEFVASIGAKLVSFAKKPSNDDSDSESNSK